MAADKRERKRLEELSAELRAATSSAIEHRSALARSLDDSRGEIERLLMLNAIEAMDLRRAILRAEMMLNAWREMAAVSFAYSR